MTTLISDCDGVLVDSEVVAFEVLVSETQAIFPQIKVSDHLVSAFGQKTESLVRQLAVKADAEIPSGFLQYLRQMTDETIKARTKVIANVDILVQWPQLKAIASNSSMSRLDAAAQLVGISQRRDVQVFSADEVPAPKPAPDLYHLVAQRLKVVPTECLVIEDSVSGVIAARDAGMSVIGFIGGAHIPFGHENALYEVGAVDVFKNMVDLPQVLEKIAGWRV